MEKKLYRSREHRVLMGLAGGLGVYFDIDPNVIRLIYAVLTVVTGVFPGVIAYILGVFIVPLEPVVTRAETIVLSDEDEPTQL